MKATAADDFAGRFVSCADERERRGDSGEDDNRGDHHADDALADDQTRREKIPSSFVPSGFRVRSARRS